MKVSSFTAFFMITLSNTLSFGMYIPTRTRELREKKRQDIFDTLAQKSQYIKDLQEISPETTLNDILQSPIALENKSTLSSFEQLAVIHGQDSAKASALLNQMSIDEVVKAINLETVLLMYPYNAKLEAVLLSKELPGNNVLENLNSDRAQSIAHALIIKKQLDSKLLEPYSNWLVNNFQIIPKQEGENLLFFNNTIKIYGIHGAHKKLGTVYQGLIVKSPYKKDIEIIFPFHSNLVEAGGNIDISNLLPQDDSISKGFSLEVDSQSKYCFLYTQSIPNAFLSRNIYHLWDLENGQEIAIPTWNLQWYKQGSSLKGSSLIRATDITAYCFANKDTLCVACTDGTIQLYSIKTSERSDIVQCNLLENEWITRIEYCLKDNQQKTIVALTDQGNIFIFNNNEMRALPFSDWKIYDDEKYFENIDLAEITDISLSNNSNKLCIIVKSKNPNYEPNQSLTSHPYIGESLWLLDINSKKKPFFISSITKNPPLEFNVMNLYMRTYWSTSDNLLITYCVYSDSSTIKSRFTITNPKTLHSWDLPPHSIISFVDLNLTKNYPHAVIANNGNSYILAGFGPTKETTLCDNNISEALNYLHLTEESDKTLSQRLVGIILLSHILGKKKPVILNATEKELYESFPQGIKTILERTDTVQSPGQQGLLASLRNPFSNLYNTISTKISEHRYKIFGGLSAVGIAALYHYFKGKQQ